MNIEQLLRFRHTQAARIPPVDRWSPALCGDMPLTIRADGSWVHEGRVIERERLVQLLTSLLRQDDVGTCLVTPVERWRITVEDLPLRVILAEWCDDAWWLTTDDGDRFRLDAEHPLSTSTLPSGDVAPQVSVRFGLHARVVRSVYYQWAEAATSVEVAPGEWELRLKSAGSMHLLGRWHDDCVGSEAP
ncbi:DUF1285 domain-containing protein [Halomonas dongshanensis]|uniref:DUF1285 domain-containing protein n=1 Tax=Halomonas dongshanensis TaxID=2890835 RepID=A0ABT2EES2_9GAMM|nr:DUF1285 domain-containing protein [Halomonas dongshanensis]MCS2610078.1 DUF1285 domain-containing protein [Halomonas dongshanensis]